MKNYLFWEDYNKSVEDVLKKINDSFEIHFFPSISVEQVIPREILNHFSIKDNNCAIWNISGSKLLLAGIIWEKERIKRLIRLEPIIHVQHFTGQLEFELDLNSIFSPFRKELDYLIQERDKKWINRIQINKGIIEKQDIWLVSFDNYKQVSEITLDDCLQFFKKSLRGRREKIKQNIEISQLSSLIFLQEPESHPKPSKGFSKTPGPLTNDFIRLLIHGETESENNRIFFNELTDEAWDIHSQLFDWLSPKQDSEHAKIRELDSLYESQKMDDQFEDASISKRFEKSRSEQEFLKNRIQEYRKFIPEEKMLVKELNRIFDYWIQDKLIHKTLLPIKESLSAASLKLLHNLIIFKLVYLKSLNELQHVFRKTFHITQNSFFHIQPNELKEASFLLKYSRLISLKNTIDYYSKNYIETIKRNFLKIDLPNTLFALYKNHFSNIESLESNKQIQYISSLKESLNDFSNEIMENLESLNNFKEIISFQEDEIKRLKRNEDQRKITKIFLQIIKIRDDIRNFESTYSHKNDDTNYTSELISSLQFLDSSIKEMLYRNGVDEFFPKYEKFDGKKHDAVEVIITSQERDDLKILNVDQPGYKIEEKIIRPALVKISKFNIKHKTLNYE